MTMGQRTIVDKTIHPLTTITQITPAGVISDVSRAGVIPVGNYKGVPAFWDLDKAVNQPLVSAEQLHIMGILDGREEGYDLRTLLIPITAIAGTLTPGTLTVPAGVVWYINCVRMNCAGDATAGFTLNWHNTAWTDRIGASALGQPFRTAAVALASAFPPGIATHTAPAGGAIQNLDEFGEISIVWLITNKNPLLRLPAATVITFTVLTDTAVPTIATACTLSLHGFVGKPLVA